LLRQKLVVALFLMASDIESTVRRAREAAARAVEMRIEAERIRERLRVSQQKIDASNERLSRHQARKSSAD